MSDATTTLTIGTPVVLLGNPDADSNVGRTGDIVEIDSVRRRYRVRWINERSGRLVNGTNGRRTWITFDRIKQTGGVK